MRRMLLAVAVSTMVWTAGLIVADDAHAGRVDHRQARQQARIGEGLATGQLTPGEAHALRDQQRAIRATKWEARSDGIVTAGERRMMERMQDRASANIHRLKHNGRTR